MKQMLCEMKKYVELKEYLTSHVYLIKYKIQIGCAIIKAA